MVSLSGKIKLPGHYKHLLNYPPFFFKVDPKIWFSATVFGEIEEIKT